MYCCPFVWGIHQVVVDSPHKGPVMQKVFPCDDILMKHDRYYDMSWLDAQWQLFDNLWYLRYWTLSPLHQQLEESSLSSMKDMISLMMPSRWNVNVLYLLSPERYCGNFKCVILQHVCNMFDISSFFSEIAFRIMPQDLSDDKLTLVQVMAWCHQATSHYLSQSQCWPRSMLPFVITRPQWANDDRRLIMPLHLNANIHRINMNTWT